MSTIAYAALTNAREASPPGTSTTTSSPGMRTYIDAFAALVPAEVLTLHALVISVTTETAQKAIAGDAGKTETVTTILPQAAETLMVAFWVLLAMSVALYVAPRYFVRRWHKLDYFLPPIPPLPSCAWTLMHRL